MPIGAVILLHVFLVRPCDAIETQRSKQQQQAKRSVFTALLAVLENDDSECDESHHDIVSESVHLFEPERLKRNHGHHLARLGQRLDRVRHVPQRLV